MAKKKSNIKYQKIENYPRYLKMLIDRKQTFFSKNTSYSRKVVSDEMTIIFNPDGESDFNILSLINMVRGDALKYLGNTSYEKREDYIHFFDLFRKPDDNEIMWKIDLKSAYWEMSKRRKIIQPQTDRKLIEIFKEIPEHLKPAKQMKSARLKALGSLATTSTTNYWDLGIKREVKPEDIVTEPTKELYMDICRDVDMLMRECVSENQTVVYYYWDCIFVPKNTAPGVLDFFKKRDYNISVDETRLSYVPLTTKEGSGGYILSESDNKSYMVRKNSIGLLDGLNGL